jgi:hypothetical protein
MKKSWRVFEMAAITYTFAPLSDVVLFDVDIPRHMKPFHAYCMKRLNIKGWRIQPADIAKEFKCSIKTACRALWWFRDHGYATKADDGKWIIYPSPQTPQPPDNNGLEPTEAWTKVSILEPVLMDKSVQLIEKEAFKEKETTTPEPIKQADMVIPVVVSLEEEEKLVFPDKLIKEQKKACKAIIKKAPAHLQQDVLFELAYRMTLQNMRSVPAFLNTLVTAANNGTFTHTQAAGATKPDSRHIDQTQERLSAYRNNKRSSSDVWRGAMSGIQAILKGGAI